MTWIAKMGGQYKYLLILYFLATCIAFKSSYANNDMKNNTIQSVAVLKKSVKTFVYNAFKKQSADIIVSISRLDSRLRLNRCQTALQTEWATHKPTGSNSVVRVKCNSQPTWKIFIPVKISLIKPIYLSKTTIVRGETFYQHQTILEKRDITRLRRGYITDAQQLKGLRAKRTIHPGEVLRKEMFLAPLLVSKGQQITLVFNSDNIQINVEGTALQDASKDELIRVKNNSSQQIVEAIVFARNKARIIY